MRCDKCGNTKSFHISVWCSVFATTIPGVEAFAVSWDDEAPLRNTRFAVSECYEIMCLECSHVLKHNLSWSDRLTNVLLAVVKYISGLKWYGH